MLFASISLVSCGADKKVETKIVPSQAEVSVKVGDSVTVKFEHDLVDGVISEFIIGDENLISIYKNGNSVTIFGKEEGKTTLTKNYNGATATIDVTVLPKDKIHSVKLDNYSIDEFVVATNQEVDLKASYYLDDEKTDKATFTYNVIDSTTGSMNETKFKATEPGDYLIKITPTYEGEISYSLIKDVKLRVVDSLLSLDYRYIGRTIERDDEVQFDNVDSGIEFGFFGTSVSATVQNRSKAVVGVGTVVEGSAKLLIDGSFEGETVKLVPGESSKVITVKNLENRYHTARIVNIFEEGFIPTVDPSSVVVEAFAPIQSKPTKSMLVLGDSISTGYCAVSSGDWLTTNSDSTYSYAYQAALSLNVDLECVASQGIGVRYGSRNKFSDNQNMIDLYKKNSIANLENNYTNVEHDIVVINLGTNDAAFIDEYNNDPLLNFEGYYTALLTEVYADNPNALFVCTYGMMDNNATISEGIKNSVNTMKNLSDNFYYFTSFTQVTSGHPLLFQHTENAQKLVDFINSVNK